jgi:hypothetical protein
MSMIVSYSGSGVKKMLRSGLRILALIALAFVLQAKGAEPGSAPLTVSQQADQLIIQRDATPVATYVFRDNVIRRPYFAQVHGPSGAQITRNHPPRPGIDPVDHDTMHPGIWLAFGDISSHDFWRNKAVVEHVEFVQSPQAKLEGNDGVVTFVAKNRYAAGDKTICFELARHTIRATRNGFLFQFDSEFSSSEPFYFGDQEEMGLGLRLATPVTVKTGNGAIINAEGNKNEKQVWGRQVDWCDYGGILTTKTAQSDKEQSFRMGLLLVPHPQNFRRSWMHARDYGLLVANPFGQRAFTKGPASRIEVKPGETLHLRFGVWAYAANPDEKLDRTALAADYLRLAEK